MQTDDEALQAALETLPAWLPWVGPVGSAAAVFVLAFTATWLALLPERRRAAGARGAHWTEWARQLWPGVTVAVAARLLCAVLGGIVATRWDGVLLAVPVRVVVAVHVVLGYGGAWIASTAHTRWILERRVGWRQMARSYLVNLLGLYSSLPVLLITMLAMPARWGWSAAGVMLGGAALFAWLASGGIIPVLRLLGLCSPADGQVVADADAAALRAGIPKPSVYWLESHSANALVLLLPRALLVTRALPEVVDEPQLRAVLAHETVHLAEPRRVAFAHVARAFPLLALAAVHPVYASYGVVAVLAVPVVALAIVLLTAHIPRAMEARADHGALHAQEDHGVYAAALERVYRHNIMPAVFGKGKRAHPDLYDRLESAGVTPHYARPAPPARRPRLLSLTALAVVLVVAGQVGKELRRQAMATVWRTDRGHIAALAWTCGEPWMIERLAAHRIDAGEPGAAPLVHLAATRAVRDPWLALNLIEHEHSLGHPEHADRLLEGVERATREDVDPWLATDVAHRHLLLGRPDRGREWYEWAVLHPDHDDGWFDSRLAVLARRLGDVAAADHHEARARELAAQRGFLEDLENHLAHERDRFGLE